RPAQRLQVEVLESRTLLTVVTWTGLDVPDVTGSRPGNPRWSDGRNWKNGVIPTNFDDVVFPAGVASTYKIDHKNGKEAPPEAFEPVNSFNDLSNLTLHSLTIGDKDFLIAGNPITLQSQLLGSSTFNAGVSVITLD